jgi:osomolarity two-component system sensor histidine kinase SLN1
VYAVFDRMAKDRKIALKVEFEGGHSANAAESSGVDGRPIYGPWGTGRVKDMVVWGDKTRILQVVINLTSNALKFTPEGGSVQVVIRCVGEIDVKRKDSFGSERVNSARTGSSRNRVHSNMSEYSDHSDRVSAAGAAGAAGRPPSTARSGSPPPHARELLYEFEVQDSGMGVPVELQDKIFEPFFQGDYSLSKKYSGTGLGLSICQQLANLMHGSIVLRSDESTGSTFTMQIPLKHVASRAGSATSTDSSSRRSPRGSMDEASNKAGSENTGKSQDFPAQVARSKLDSQPRLVGLSAPFFAHGPNLTGEDREKEKLGGRKLRILIAEDNKTNQMVVLRMLRMEKIFNVDLAEDGNEALARVVESMDEDRQYSVIFMDVQMPNMDGLEATRLIRQAGCKRPIIALSAYSDDTNVEGCHEAGMDDFISKPIQIARLRLVLKTYCPDDTKVNAAPPSRSEPRPLSNSFVRGTGDRKDNNNHSGSSSSSALKTAPLAPKPTPAPTTNHHVAELDSEDVSPLTMPTSPPPPRSPPLPSPSS